MINGPIITREIRIEPFFRWYDLWMGAYINLGRRAIYICPLPMIGVKIWRVEIARCSRCGNRAEKTAIHTGDGWLLCWECPLGCLEDEESFIDWPFGDAWLTADELKHLGYAVN